MSSGLRWTGSDSSGEGGERCRQVSYAWRKSTYSSGGSGECVEVATCACPEPSVRIRDSKDPEGPVLRFASDAWAAFLRTT